MMVTYVGYRSGSKSQYTEEMAKQEGVLHISLSS